MKTKRITIFLLAFFLLGTSIYAFKPRDNYHYYSLFIYKFTQYFEWPPSQNQGDFVIGVLGQSPINKWLQQMAKNQRVGNRRIRIKQYASANSIRERCHIIFLSKTNSRELSRLVRNNYAKPTLIVSEQVGLIKGGSMVNFIGKDGRVQIEVNQRMLNTAHLKVSKNFLRIAIVR